jgi:hypothetical protein
MQSDIASLLHGVDTYDEEHGLVYVAEREQRVTPLVRSLSSFDARGRQNQRQRVAETKQSEQSNWLGGLTQSTGLV